MKNKRTLLIGLLVLSLIAMTSVAMLSDNTPKRKTLIEVVRQETERYQDVKEAEAAGYAQFHGCASGPNEGAMGVHYVNGNLVGDGELDPMKPEALIYEYKNSQARLVGVEFVTFAEAWDAKHDTPPTLMGQLFNYAGSPNRYGIPAYYELHVWAWKSNPKGTFADWNPTVSCADFAPEDAAAN